MQKDKQPGNGNQYNKNNNKKANKPYKKRSKPSYSLVVSQSKRLATGKNGGPPWGLRPWACVCNRLDKFMLFFIDLSYAHFPAIISLFHHYSWFLDLV